MKKRKNEIKTKQCTITELMLSIRPHSHLYYHKDTGVFDWLPVSSIELETLTPDARIPWEDDNNFPLPDYEEINHQDIMRFFVRECVDDKKIRKQLFDILRRHDYIDAYVEALQNLNLYDEFDMVCGDIYYQIFSEWEEKNGLK